MLRLLSTTAAFADQCLTEYQTKENKYAKTLPLLEQSNASTIEIKCNYSYVFIFFAI